MTADGDVLRGDGCNGNDQVVTDDDGIERFSMPAKETTQVVTGTGSDDVTKVLVAGQFQDTFEAVVR